MKRLQPGSTTRWSARVLLALSVVALVASSSRAGCLYPHQAGSSRGAAHLDLLASAGALAATDASVPALPVVPCAGLRCSTDPIPTSPSVPVAAPRAEHWGCLTKDESPPASGIERLVADPPIGCPTHGGPAPFHPPR